MNSVIKEIFHRKSLNVSNLLSLSRIFILPVFVYLAIEYLNDVANTKVFVWLLATIVYSIISDFLDGFLARKLHQETRLGRYLDPVADKLTSLTALGLITAYFKFPLWIYLCIIARDITGVWAGGYLFFKRDTQGEPNIWGKVGVGVTAVLVLWYISMPWLKHNYPENTGWMTQPQYLTWFLLFILAMGVIRYKRDYWDLAFHPSKDNTK